MFDKTALNVFPDVYYYVDGKRVKGSSKMFVSQQKTEKIVDDTHFKPTAEIKRDRVASDSMGSDRGLYDSDTRKDPPTDIEMALRSGKLDKADIQKLQKQLKESADGDVKKKRELEAAQQELDKAHAREKALDEILGTAESNSENS